MLTWFDSLMIGGLILIYLLTGLSFWRYSRGSAIIAKTTPDLEETELWKDIMIRLALEHKQVGTRYNQLEADYNAAIQRVHQLEAQLTRRTNALENCRKLLEEKQGVDDSGDLQL